MTENRPKSPEPEPFPYKAAIFRETTPEALDETADFIANIMADMFNEQYRERKNVVKEVLSDDTYTFTILYDTSQPQDKVIGFSLAEPRPDDNQTAYLSVAAIDEEYRGKGLIGLVAKTTEEELRRKKYRFVETDAMVNNGLANNLRRHYGERILFERDSTYSWQEDGPRPPQKFFRFKL